MKKWEKLFSMNVWWNVSRKKKFFYCIALYKNCNIQSIFLVVLTSFDVSKSICRKLVMLCAWWWRHGNVCETAFVSNTASSDNWADITNFTETMRICTQQASDREKHYRGQAMGRMKCQSCAKSQNEWFRLTLTHSGVSKLTIVGSDNGLAPTRRRSHYRNQCWHVGNSILMNTLQCNVNRNSYIFIQEMFLKMSSGNCRPFCPGCNVLNSERCHMIHIRHNICHIWV